MTALHTTYLDRAIDGELSELREADGGRNNALFRVAARLYQFVEVGAADELYITDLLSNEADALGLNRSEIKASLKSARKRAAGMDEAARQALRQKCEGVSHDASPGAEYDPTPPEPVDLPSSEWREKAEALVAWAGRKLWSSTDPEAERQRVYLRRRGVTLETAAAFDLGWNPTNLERSRAAWGLAEDDDRGDRLWLPAGIVIPWYINGDLWKITIRRPIEGANKYYTVPGSANALYNADVLHAKRPAMLVEGIFDAIAVTQAANDLIGAVACGTTGARRVRWLSKLAQCYPVLIALDADGPGQHAASYWLSALGTTARIWRPYFDDPAAMLAAGSSVRAWVQAGLDEPTGAAS